MLVEISSLDNGSGTYDMLDVYLCYNPQQKLFEFEPYCKIWEDDFCELIGRRDIDNLSNGKIIFNVNKSKLTEKAKTIYSQY
jgi:hypothetical protein